MATEIRLNLLARYQRNAWLNITEMGGTMASELSKLTPKCGKIKVHHWAHKNDLNCDSWREPETEPGSGKIDFPTTGKK